MHGLGQLQTAAYDFYGEHEDGCLHGRGVQRFKDRDCTLVGWFTKGSLDRGPRDAQRPHCSSSRAPSHSRGLVPSVSVVG